MKINTNPSKLYRWFWPLIGILAVVRLGLSMYLMMNHNFFFTLSADDVARYRIALLWSENPSFFPDPTWPPLPFWLGGLLIKLFSTGAPTLCYLSITASLLSLPLLGLLCLGVIPPSTPAPAKNQIFPLAVTLAVFVFYPRWIWLGTSMLAESLYTFLFLLTLFTFLLAIERKSVRWGLAALGTAAMASLTRLEGIALTGFCFLLLTWRFRKISSKSSYALFITLGSALTVLFPILWWLGHNGGTHGGFSYFATLKNGYAAQYGYNVLWTPMQFIRMYIDVSPLFLFLILSGFVTAWHQSAVTPSRDLIRYQIFLILAYGIAQITASALGMMPTHTFWRLTVPVFVAMLPYLSVVFAVLNSQTSARSLMLPAALCVFYLIPSYPKPDVFVTPDLYRSAMDLKDVQWHQPSGREKTLMEVGGWEWLPMAVLSHGSQVGDLLYDRATNPPQNESLNPTLFNRPLDQVESFIQTHQVDIVVVHSISAKEKMMQLGWKAARSGRYAIFLAPSDRL